MPTDYRSPAATHSTYAKDDPTAPQGVTGTGVAYAGHPSNDVVVSDPNATSTSTTNSTTAHPHHHHHGAHHHHHDHPATTSSTTTTDPKANPSGSTTGITGANETTGSDRVVKTGEYVTGLEPAAANLGPTPIPVIGSSHQNRIAGAPQQVGPVPQAGAGPLHTTGGPVPAAAAGQSGPLGGGVVLGGQCECMRNGGTCPAPGGAVQVQGLLDGGHGGPTRASTWAWRTRRPTPHSSCPSEQWEGL